MAYIRVDHAKLSAAADRINGYVKKHSRAMKNMRASVEGLSSSWSGEDYMQLMKEWNEIEAADSTSGLMLKSIQNHSDSLKNAAEKYKEAQARAVNRANLLCR